MNFKAMAAVALLFMVITPIGLGYITSVEESEEESWSTKQTVNVSDLLLNHSTEYLGAYTGTTNNNLLGSGLHPDYVKTGTVYTPYPTFTQVRHDRSIGGLGTDTVISYSEWFTAVPEGVTLFANSSAGITQNVEAVGPAIVSCRDNYVYVDGFVESNAANTLTWHASASGTFSIVEFTTTSTYANVAYGWRSPVSVPYAWNNGQDNQSVSMTLNVPSGAVIDLADIRIKSTGGTISVGNYVEETSTILGDYSALSVLYTGDTVTVSGLAAWPPVAGAEQPFNSVTVSHSEEIAADLFPGIGIHNPGRDVTIRIDSANVVAGTFPSTKDVDFTLADLYPAESYSIKINSVGVYGDSLGINGINYSVDTGKITIGTRAVNVRGAVISSAYSEDLGQYVVKINDETIGSSEDPLTVSFGGEWSLTASADILELTSTTKMTWQPGGFGLDREGFAAAGLIAAGITFVVLGMQGRMNGTKVGLLLLLCGGAAFAYFSFL